MSKGIWAGIWKKVSIRYTIFIYFTISALVAMLLSGEIGRAHV